MGADVLPTDACGDAAGGGAAAVAPRPFHGAGCPLVLTGAWQLSSGHSARADGQARAESVAALKAHAEAGLDCFDCADIYTGVEELLGDVRKAGCKIRVHTKCVPDLDSMLAGTVTFQYLEAGILRSLNRLEADALDLVQLHWWDYSVPGFAEAFALLCKLSDEGLIRCVGLTNTDLPHMQQLVDSGHRVASNQVQLSLLDRRPLDSGMLAFCAKQGIELLCYGALAGGFLTDAWFGRDDPGCDSLENRSLTKYRLIIDEYGSWEDFQRLLGLLSAIARRRGADIAAVAIGWVLRQGPTRVILGARGAQHVEKAASASAVALSAADVAELDAEVHGRGIGGEVFGAERAGGRHTGIMRRNLNGIGGAGHVAECRGRLERALAAGREPSPLLLREAELLRVPVGPSGDPGGAPA